MDFLYNFRNKHAIFGANLTHRPTLYFHVSTLLFPMFSNAKFRERAHFFLCGKLIFLVMLYNNMRKTIEKLMRQWFIIKC